MEWIVGNLIKTFIISSVWIIALLILRSTLFKKYRKVVSYYCWIILLIRMMLPFRITIDITDFIDNANNSISDFFKLYINIGDKIERISSIQIIGYIWFIGAIIIAIYKISTYIALKKNILGISYVVEDKKIINIYNKVLKDMDIKRKIHIKQNKDNVIPFGIGIFKKYIVLPNINYADEQIEWILKHELTHFKYNDILVKMLYMIVSIIYWFNPLIYLISKVIEADCELSCDERVLKSCQQEQKQQYALTILSSVKQCRNNDIGISTTLGRGFSIKVRVERIFAENLKRGFTIIACIFLLLLATTVSFTINDSQTMNKYNTKIEQNE